MHNLKAERPRAGRANGLRSIESAFTLVELLIVVVILAVLASVATPIYLRQLEKARVDATIADISHIKTALETFAVDNGRYPSTQEGLEALVVAPSDLQNTWNGSYLEKMPADKWNHSYLYEFPSSEDGRAYVLTSRGKDGELNTEDDITRFTAGGAPPTPGR